MLSKCANPSCSATFRFLREGRILLVESPAAKGKLESLATRRREHFWLCDSCSKTLTMVSHSSGAHVVPLEDESKAKAVKKETSLTPLPGLSSP